MRVATVLVLVVVFGTAACSSGRKGFVRVPPVDTTSLGIALQELQHAGLRVQLSDFGPLPDGYGLESASVGDQDPEAPTRVRRGSVVRLNMHGANPIPSPVFPIHHPKFVVVPRLVGLEWPSAEKRLSSGYLVRLGAVPGLSARLAEDVLSSYVVTAQSPAAGTRLPFAGVLSSRGLRVSVVELSIGVR